MNTLQEVIYLFNFFLGFNNDSVKENVADKNLPPSQSSTQTLTAKSATWTLTPTDW